MMIKRRLLALLMVMILCCTTLAIPAFAYAEDPDPDIEIVVPTEEPPKETQTSPSAETNPPEETTVPTVPSLPLAGTGFTEDGNVITRDLLYDEATNKQFITIETRNGEIFYLVIDYDKPIDEDANLYETYFLNPVDEADLKALLEEETTPAVCSCTEKCVAGNVNTDCVICAVNMVECVGIEPETEPTVPETEPVEEPKENKSSGAAVAIVLFIVMIGCFAFYYVKHKLPKPKTKGNTDLSEYDYGVDEDDEYAEFDPYEEEKETEDV